MLWWNEGTDSIHGFDFQSMVPHSGPFTLAPNSVQLLVAQLRNSSVCCRGEVGLAAMRTLTELCKSWGSALSDFEGAEN